MIVKPRRTQNTAKKKLFSSFLFLLSCLSAETGFPAFDVFTSSSQLGMGGAGFLNPSPISSKLNPSVADTGRYFSTSIIRYQAGITSQSAGMSLPWKKGFGVFSLRHISYGTFDGYDDDFQSTGTYQSGDTWLHGGYSKQLGTLPLSIGTAAQFYSSSLKDHQVKAFVISVGSDFYIHKFKAALGLSFHNIGKTAPSMTWKEAHLLISEQVWPMIFELRTGMLLLWALRPGARIMMTAVRVPATGSMASFTTWMTICLES